MSQSLAHRRQDAGVPPAARSRKLEAAVMLMCQAALQLDDILKGQGTSPFWLILKGEQEAGGTGEQAGLFEVNSNSHPGYEAGNLEIHSYRGR